MIYVIKWEKIDVSKPQHGMGIPKISTTTLAATSTFQDRLELVLVHVYP